MACNFLYIKLKGPITQYFCREPTRTFQWYAFLKVQFLFVYISFISYMIYYKRSFFSVKVYLQYNKKSLMDIDFWSKCLKLIYFSDTN